MIFSLYSPNPACIMASFNPCSRPCLVRKGLVMTYDCCRCCRGIPLVLMYLLFVNMYLICNGFNAAQKILVLLQNLHVHCAFQVDAVVYLVDAFDKERFAESKKELDSLLSDEALANVPFLVLGNKIDIPYAASEEELRYHLGLTNFTTGKGKVNLNESNLRPLEVFMCSIVRKMGYGEGFRWVSQYIKQSPASFLLLSLVKQHCLQLLQKRFYLCF